MVSWEAERRKERTYKCRLVKADFTFFTVKTSWYVKDVLRSLIMYLFIHST